MSSATQRMPARSSDPWVSVYVLGQFAFCPRAGLIAFWDRQDEEDADDTPPHLNVSRYRSFSVPYSMMAIERKLARVTAVIALSAIIAIAATLMVLYGAISTDENAKSIEGFLTLVTSVGVLIAACVVAIKNWSPLRRLKALHQHARNAKPIEPNPDDHETQKVSWWGLIRTGYVSRPCNEKISFENWKLVGSPFRILQKGNVRIPVLRVRGDNRHLSMKHFVRGAAYCTLLEQSGADSPFALVLFRDTYDCVTIPNSPGSRRSFHDTLVFARATIQCPQNAQSPMQRKCSRCKHGAPKKSGITFYKQGQALKPCYAMSTREICFHSYCGDLFRWIPPHNQAKGLGLED